MAKAKKKQISLWATPSEVHELERIKEFHGRHTLSDTLRYLIDCEHKKILTQNVAVATN